MKVQGVGNIGRIDVLECNKNVNKNGRNASLVVLLSYCD